LARAPVPGPVAVRRQEATDVLPLVAVYCPAGHGLHDWLPGLELYVLVGHTGIPPRPPEATPAKDPS